MATQEDLRWLKKEFVSVWKSTPAQTKSLSQPHTSDYEQLEAVRWKARSRKGSQSLKSAIKQNLLVQGSSDQSERKKCQSGKQKDRASAVL